MQNVKRNSLMFLVAGLAGAATIACGGPDGSIEGHYSPNPLKVPVYESNATVVYKGSVYFAEAGCAKCHGVGFDGNGPDASGVQSESGLAVPGFQGVTIEPEKTPLAYFKAVTVGTDKLPSHSYQSYTDRGRWAMAHFLYSLTTKPSGAKGAAHAAQLAKDEQAVHAAYAADRRWVMGYKPIGERDKAPELGSLMKLASVDEEYATVSADDERKARRDADHPGAALYENNCVQCHGKYGEGMASSKRFGLVRCDDRKRQCGVFLSTKDFADSAALQSTGAFSGAHGAASDAGQNLRSFSHFSADEWQDLYDYTRKLAGR